MRRIAANFAVASVAAGMVAIIGGLSMTGRWPGHAGLEHFAPSGLIATPAGDVARVEVATPAGQTVFQRVAGRWARAGQQDEAGAGELSKHVEAALRFLN